MLLVAEGIDWLLEAHEAVDGVVVEALQGAEGRQLLVVALEGTGDGELDVAGGFQAGIHNFLEVLHGLGHCLQVGVVGLEGEPARRMRLGGEAGLVHALGDEPEDASLVKFGDEAVLCLKLLLQLFNELSDVAHHIERLGEVDQVGVAGRGDWNLWVDVGLDVRSPFEAGVDY